MKSKFLLLIAFFTSSSLFSMTQEYLSIDLAVFLDNEEVRLQQTIGPLTVTLRNLVTNPNTAVPFIATSSLLFAVTKYSTILQTKFTDFYFYKSEHEDFIIAFPKSYLQDRPVEQQQKIKSLGFKADQLTLLRNYTDLEASIKPTFSINVENFKKLFVPVVKLKDDIAIPIKKRIFLMGHGGYSAEFGGSGYIAGLPLDEYQKLLEFFNSINVDFLYLVSCYAGGVGATNTAFFKKDEQNTAQIKPNYFIMIGSTTDTVMYRVDYNFKQFFKTVGDFLDKGRIENCRNPKGIQEDPFKCIQRDLTTDERLQNIPSVRFPGSTNYFKAVDAGNNLFIITYARATARKQEIPALRKFVIEPNKDAILLYPIDIQVPIEFKQSVIPLISMIPGNSFHIIPKLSINQSLSNLIRFGFFPIDILSGKIFLIKTLEINNIGDAILNFKNEKIQLNNVMIWKEDGPKESITIQFEFENKFYSHTVSYDEPSKSYSKITSVREENKNDLTFLNYRLKLAINRIAKGMKPSAVYSGQETIEQLSQRAIAEFTLQSELESALPFRPK